MSSGDRTLGNKQRRLIYNLIVTYPGVSFNNIMNIFELTDSNLRYHLNYLEKNDKIRSSIENGIRNYYPHPANVKLLKTQQPAIESQRLSSEQEKLLDIVKRNPRINQEDLVKRSGMNRVTAIRQLNSLKDLNLIKNTKFQNNVYYEYIPDIETKFIILKGLILKFLRNEIDEATFIRLKKRLD